MVMGIAGITTFCVVDFLKENVDVLFMCFENKKPLLWRGSENILSSLDNVLQTPFWWCIQHIIPTELKAIFLFFWCCKDTLHFFGISK
jgi:hypothetical protein